ncbi:MAG: UvrB/UvrC motif-containing protein [Elusimicrobiota bacterium]
MICEICNKQEATIHIEAEMDNKPVKLHLCESCAQEKGVEFGLSKPHFSLVDLLANLSDWEIPGHKTINAVKCPVCGLTYNQFKGVGRLGCENCYSAFSAQLDPLLKRIHGSSKHVGKKILPEQKSEDQISELRRQLEEAIKTEEFEKAAVLRDKIKDINAASGKKDETQRVS